MPVPGHIKNDLNQLLGVLIIEISDSFLQSIIAEEPYKTIIAVDSAHIVSSTTVNSSAKRRGRRHTVHIGNREQPVPGSYRERIHRR